MDKLAKIYFINQTKVENQKQGNIAMGIAVLKTVFSNRNILTVSLTSLLANFFMMLYMPWWSLYLLELGATYQIIALLGVIQASERLLFQLPGGMLADRLGRKKLALLGAGTRIATPIAYLMAKSWVHLIPGTLFAAMGSISGPGFTAMIAESLPKNQMGTGYAAYRMTMMVPMIFTGAIGGMLMDAFGVTHGMKICLVGSLIGSIVTFLGRYFFLTETLDAKQRSREGFVGSVKEVLPVMKGRNLLAMNITSIVSQFSLRLIGPFTVLYVVNNIGLSKTQWGLISTIMSVISLLTSLPGGMIADKYNRRILIFIGRILNPITTIGYIFLRDFYLILTVRLIAGIGAGLSGAGMGWMGGPAWSSLLADIIPSEKRARVTGLMGTFSGVLSLPASNIGAYMWEGIGPEPTFAITVIMGISAAIIFAKYVRDPRGEERKQGVILKNLH